ncbi:MAG: 30S ribosomal protein S12 methylthiotransferase RimO [candidate division WOR-3 bacterium]|nr:MAG: 30S ribosomal protein S12 methylthiotransferase RimO [candidate division WOR-3 bacterium]
MKINMVSLGCPKNLVDSEKILGALCTAGIEISDSAEDCDAMILNTCAFISPAMDETESEIQKCLGLATDGRRLFVVGCAVNRYGDELKQRYPTVAGWYSLEDVPALIKKLAPGAALNLRTRLPTTHGFTYLKISDGCSNSCSYCTIPSIKGPHRSFDINDLVAEANELAVLGFTELILIGQDTTRYGIDVYGKPMLIPLLNRLAGIPGIEWLRLMYAHPRTIDESVIKEITRNPKICKYIDLPIQHINSRILKSMNRGVDRHRIVEVVRELKSIPDIALRTTIIVGYPTETDDEFSELMEFLSQGYFDWLGVFPYYREPGTRAAQLPQLPDEVITDRYEMALALQQELLKRKNTERCGKTYQTLIHARDRQFVGHAKFCAPEIDSRILIHQGNLALGRTYDIQITDTVGTDLRGEVTNVHEKRGTRSET